MGYGACKALELLLNRVEEPVRIGSRGLHHSTGSEDAPLIQMLTAVA
jgi:hypothetical protein